MNKHKEHAEALLTLYPTPQAMLAVEGFGTEKRARYQASMSINSGPAELKTLARQAVINNDRILAAVLVNHIDHMPTDKRPFSSQELAERMIGAEWRALTDRLKETAGRAKAGRDLIHELRSGKSDATAKIERGLAAKRATQ